MRSWSPVSLYELAQLLKYCAQLPPLSSWWATPKVPKPKLLCASRVSFEFDPVHVPVSSLLHLVLAVKSNFFDRLCSQGQLALEYCPTRSSPPPRWSLWCSWSLLVLTNDQPKHTSIRRGVKQAGKSPVPGQQWILCTKLLLGCPCGIFSTSFFSSCFCVFSAVPCSRGFSFPFSWLEYRGHAPGHDRGDQSRALPVLYSFRYLKRCGWILWCGWSLFGLNRTNQPKSTAGWLVACLWWFNLLRVCLYRLPPRAPPTVLLFCGFTFTHSCTCPLCLYALFFGIATDWWNELNPGGMLFLWIPLLSLPTPSQFSRIFLSRWPFLFSTPAQ